jgi:hypothetical protein
MYDLFSTFLLFSVIFFIFLSKQVNVNLAGLPALVLPCGFVDGGPTGLPVGLQMIGAAFDEVLNTRVAIDILILELLHTQTLFFLSFLQERWVTTCYSFW